MPVIEHVGAMDKGLARAVRGLRIRVLNIHKLVGLSLEMEINSYLRSSKYN